MENGEVWAMLEGEERKNLIKIAVGSAVLSGIVVLVFVIIGKFDYTVLIGALTGFVLSVGNFYFMSVGIIKALETGDENTAKAKMRTSYIIRTVIMLGIMAASFFIPFMNPIPVLLSVFYPRITIFVCDLFEKRKKSDEPSVPVKESAKESAEDPEEEEESDEFEKFVKRFSKGPVPGEEDKGKPEKDAATDIKEKED